MTKELKLLQEWTPLDLPAPNVIEENMRKNGGKLLLRGILQKADTLNQNGRVYPRAVLEREVRNYQKFINERRAIGELDHPSCVTKDTEIFTSKGWKSVADVLDDEVVCTLHLATNEIQFQRITAKIDEQYIGPMHRIKNARTFDMLLTPKHRVLVWDRKMQPQYIEAEKLHALWTDKSSWLSHSCLKRSGSWTGIEPPAFILPPSLGTRGVEARPERRIDIEDWAAFLGIWIAEGHYNGANRGYKVSNGVGVSQKKSGTKAEIKSLLERAFPALNIIENDGGFIFADASLHTYLSQFGNSHQKFLPDDAKSWSPRLLDILMTWMLKGDGKNRTSWSGCSAGRIIREYCTTSPQLASDAFEVFLKLGSGATIHTYDQPDRPAPDHATTGRMILAENSWPMNIVAEHSSRSMSLDHRFMTSEIVDFDGRVYCVTTPNGNWLMRHNGCVCWTGNSSVVELKNGSHIVLEAIMEGDIVKGTIEVLTKLPMGKVLQGYIEHGIKMGISSRGVGSTTNEGSKTMVNDDFQLICFDMVAEPSTANAFMLAEGKVIRNSKGKVITSSDQLDEKRLMSIVESILSH